MTKLRVNNYSLSLDGYAAGPDQTVDQPLGAGGESLHEWAFATRTFRRMFGQEGGEDGLDESFAAQGDVGIGATIMGRNMFGPIRGVWPDEEWTGWWGDEPPYHHQVFVLTHHPRASVQMQGGTTFHFVTEGIHAALERATDAAAGQDVKVAGGAAAIQQYLAAGLIDDLHLVITPVLLGAGERLFDNIGDALRGYETVGFVASPAALHVRIARKQASS